MRLWHTLPVLLLSLLIATLLVPGTAAAAAKKTQRVSVSSAGVQGNNYSGGNAPSVSADGRFVVFDSPASNLVAGDTNGYMDVFVRDRKLHRTYLVSVSSAGVQGNGDSFDALDLGRRSLRGVRLRGQQPGGRRQQWIQGRLRARP